ncbi:MAG: LysR substrate-binding domain-containing protein [Burkholderiaceae bacterium]
MANRPDLAQPADAGPPTSANTARRRFTLRQLEAFVEVARLGSASAAASRLSRTQSAISMALQELESALGCALFERRGRRLVATEAADDLLPKAIEMVDRAQEISEAVASGPQTRARLALGASRTVGPFAMPALISQCHEQVAGLHINLTIANSEDLVRRIHGFELDCAFVEGDVIDPALEKTAWLDDQLCLIARKSHPIFKSRKSLDSRLATSAWVLREQGSGSREIFLRAIASIMPQPVVALELNDPETQKRCVRNSDWLTCISRRAIQDELRSGELREISGLPASLRKALTRRFWIVTHPGRFETSALQSVLSIAKSM